jgi:hypothetical protein
VLTLSVNWPKVVVENRPLNTRSANARIALQPPSLKKG